MSLILDALNRAEKERSEPELPSTSQAVPMSSASSASPVGRSLIIIFILLLAAALIVFSVNQLGRQSEAIATTELATTEIAATNTTASTAGPATEKTLDQNSEPPATMPLNHTPSKQAKPNLPDSIATVQSQPANPPAIAPVPDATAPPVSAPVDNSQAQSIAKLYANRPLNIASKESADRPVNTSATKSTPPTPVKANTRNTILQGIPLLTTMSPRLQQQVPSIDYSVHVYNEDDGSGAVKLNGQLRRIGSELAPGLRVIAILPDSVVLDLNGTQFRLAALNSWVNF